MDQNQANEHDLQKAIEDITKGTGAPKVDLVEEIATRFAEQAKPVAAPAQASMAGTPELPMPPVMGAAANVENGTSAGMEMTGVNDSEILKIKEAVLRDLAPLMDKVEMEDGQKFELYMEMMTVLKDKGLIAKAHEIARRWGEEGERAKKLLRLVEVINNF